MTTYESERLADADEDEMEAGLRAEILFDALEAGELDDAEGES